MPGAFVARALGRNVAECTTGVASAADMLDSEGARTLSRGYPETVFIVFIVFRATCWGAGCGGVLVGVGTSVNGRVRNGAMEVVEDARDIAGGWLVGGEMMEEVLFVGDQTS